MIPQWQVFLNRVHPPGAIANFSAAAFALEAAVNLRLALKSINRTTECIARAEEVYERAKAYGELREASSTLVTDAERDLAGALRLLSNEMRNCDPAWKANNVLIGLMLADRRANAPSSLTR
jgi:hypothetical protein